MAVNLVNALPRDRYLPFLCTTREEGPLASHVASDVVHLHLDRKSRFDPAAVFRLVAFVREHRIRVVHAYSASLFMAVAAACFHPYPAVIWHDHYGYLSVKERPFWWLYRVAAERISGIIAVTQPLAEWSRRRMGVPDERIWYIPNFVCAPARRDSPPALPGVPGHRIVCVAHYRPEKDHVNLLRAMRLVVQQVPTAHLLLVGTSPDSARREFIRNEIGKHRLDRNVSMLGQCNEVHPILAACDIGVLSSVSEGLPLALLEYGMARVPVVATDTGQCAEVLDYGRAGILTSVESPRQMATALVSLLRSPERRATMGGEFHKRVQAHYSPKAVIEQICRVYETVRTPSDPVNAFERERRTSEEGGHMHAPRLTQNIKQENTLL